jgi:hypothetical protein
MTTKPKTGSPALLWQGFHHAWKYNHRLNRLGSYVRHPAASDGGQPPIVGHTAASGTGGDVAHFTEYVTPIRAPDVGIQAGYGETTVECIRAETNPFRIKIKDLPLDPELQGKDDLVAVINGFDLIAEQQADKLIAFDLEITDPTVYAGGTKVRFDVLGSLRFDCRTGECQLWPFRLEAQKVGRRRKGERARAKPPDETQHPSRGIPRYQFLETSVSWLKRQIAKFTDLENVKEAVVGDDQDTLRRRLFRVADRQFYLSMLKWRIATPYILRVHYLILAGDEAAMRVTEPDYVENTYSWDVEHEIHAEEQGTQSLEVKGEPPDAFGLNTLAFTHLSLETQIDHAFSADNPIQWGQGMHLLEWNFAIRDIRPEDGYVSATMDLFYKCWSEAMNEVITLTTWGALRSAGQATVGARLLLLQLKHGASATQLALPGEITWPGGGINANNHPRAQFERPVPEAEGSAP